MLNCFYLPIIVVVQMWL